MNKIIVYTYGVFDILHPGHINVLKNAKALGDFLVVGIVADEPVRKLKGDTRPIMPQADRAALISALKCVDDVVLQKEYDPSQNILQYTQKINILTKGDDWDFIPGTSAVESIGGKLIKLPYTQSQSTSAIIRKIQNG